MKETIQQWIGEDRAVSPVIGVILMVAITVILAAVIGTFVLDLGQNVQNTGPSASLGMQDAEEAYVADGAIHDFIVIEHQSGETLEGDAIRVIIRNVSNNGVVATYDTGTVTNTTGGTDWLINTVELNATSTITVGDQIVVRAENTTVGGGPKPGFDYSVTVVSTDTDNRIATGTVEVN